MDPAVHFWSTKIGPRSIFRARARARCARSRSPNYIYIRVVRRALNLLRAFFSDISIFLRRKCYTRFFFSDISIFRKLCMPCAMEFYSSPLDSLGLTSSAMDSSAILYTSQVLIIIVYCYDTYKQNPNKCIVHVLYRCCCTCR